MANGNGIGVEVNGIPFEAQDFTSTQTIKGSQFDGQFQ